MQVQSTSIEIKGVAAGLTQRRKEPRIILDTEVDGTPAKIDISVDAAIFLQQQIPVMVQSIYRTQQRKGK